MKSLLSIEGMTEREIISLVEQASVLKEERGQSTEKPLKGQTWAMIFAKSSTRTRVSFEVGIQELGGTPMFLSSNDIQLGRGEPIRDTARVLGRMVHGVVIRTFAQEDIVDFAEYSQLPVINALTDDEHPCQILADLLTIAETKGTWEGANVAFVGDGFSNMTRSWMWAAKILNFRLTVASPEIYQPPSQFLADLSYDGLTITTDPYEAVAGADFVNTDVWLSMGQEDESEKEAQFEGYQVNEQLLAHAAPDVSVLHCLPAYRGKEISEETLEMHADTIFRQAENRLHAQKAVLMHLSRSSV